MLSRRGLMVAGGALAMDSIARRTRAGVPGTIIFSQPSLPNGIIGNFSATGALPPYNPVGTFYIHYNQINPFNPAHSFSPVRWAAGELTGLYVPQPSTQYQLGIVAPGDGASGHTVAQAYGPAVGAFINSADLPDGSPGMRQMVAAEYNFAPGLRPFLTSTSVVGLSYLLQVPTATDDPGPNAISNAYAKHSIVLVDDNGGRIAYSFNSFSNGNSPKKDGAGFDTLTNTAICTALLGPTSKLATLMPGSAAFRNTPWRGWASYAMTFSYQQFQYGIALAQVAAAPYGVKLSSNPAAYSMSETHMNAELHYTPENPATLGWSMRDLTITQVST